MIHKQGHVVRTELAMGRVEVSGERLLALVVRTMGVAPAPQMSLLEADRLSLVGALAAGFAHETNNPLTSVLLNLRSLRRQLTSQLSDQAQVTAVRCLDDITTGAERIASNVRALQTLATRGSTQTAELTNVVSAVLRLAAPTLEPRAHVIRQIYPVGRTDDPIEADDHRRRLRPKADRSQDGGDQPERRDELGENLGRAIAQFG